MDVLDEICGLREDLARFQHFSPPPPFDDGFCLSFGIPSQKGGVFCFCFQGESYFLVGVCEVV